MKFSVEIINPKLDNAQELLHQSWCEGWLCATLDARWIVVKETLERTHEELQELIMVFQNWWKDPWPRPLAAPFFWVAAENLIPSFSFSFYFLVTIFKNRTRMQFKHELIQFGVKIMSLFHLLFVALLKRPLRGRLKLATALQILGRSAAMARGGRNRERWVSAAGLNAGLHGN